LRAGADTHSAFGIASFQFLQANLQAQGIEWADREDADATLGAPRTADQPVSAPLGRVRECGVNNLDEPLVSSG